MQLKNILNTNVIITVGAAKVLRYSAPQCHIHVHTMVASERVRRNIHSLNVTEWLLHVAFCSLKAFELVRCSIFLST